MGIKNKPLGVAGRRDVAHPLALGPAGFFDLADELDAIEENLKSLVFTNPGERLMRPDIGMPFNLLIFEPVDEVFTSLVETFVISQITKFEPRIALERVTVVREDSELNPEFDSKGKVRVFIQWRHRRSNRQSETEVRAEFRRRAA